jgi:hypothetical protein
VAISVLNFEKLRLCFTASLFLIGKFAALGCSSEEIDALRQAEDSRSAARLSAEFVSFIGEQLKSDPEAGKVLGIIKAMVLDPKIRFAKNWLIEVIADMTGIDEIELRKALKQEKGARTKELGGILKVAAKGLGKEGGKELALRAADFALHAVSPVAFIRQTYRFGQNVHHAIAEYKKSQQLQQQSMELAAVDANDIKMLRRIAMLKGGLTGGISGAAKGAAVGAISGIVITVIASGADFGGAVALYATIGAVSGTLLGGAEGIDVGLKTANKATQFMLTFESVNALSAALSELDSLRAVDRAAYEAKRLEYGLTPRQITLIRDLERYKKAKSLAAKLGGKFKIGIVELKAEAKDGSQRVLKSLGRNIVLVYLRMSFLGQIERLKIVTQALAKLRLDDPGVTAKIKFWLSLKAKLVAQKAFFAAELAVIGERLFTKKAEAAMVAQPVNPSRQSADEQAVIKEEAAAYSFVDGAQRMLMQEQTESAEVEAQKLGQ